VLDGDDVTLLHELDRLLVAAGRHDSRAVLWMREAALADDTRSKTHALLIASEAAAAAGRDVEAARHRQAAWLADPSAPGVFDALAERLEAPGAPEAVAERVELYVKAAERTSDLGKRLHYLEKVAWLWDDVAGDAARAAQAYEDVLAIDPTRRSAIAGLASAATRARDGRRLARSSPKPTSPPTRWPRAMCACVRPRRSSTSSRSDRSRSPKSSRSPNPRRPRYAHVSCSRAFIRARAAGSSWRRRSPIGRRSRSASP